MTATIYPDEADVIIHYACGFTEQQMVEIFNHIVYYEKVKKDDAILIFCGCGLSGYTEEFFNEISIVDYFIEGIDMLPRIAQIMRIVPTDNQYYEEGEGEFRIKIGDGCYKPKHQRPCNFCKQNYLKIPTRSRYA